VPLINELLGGVVLLVTGPPLGVKPHPVVGPYRRSCPKIDELDAMRVRAYEEISAHIATVSRDTQPLTPSCPPSLTHSARARETGGCG